jgi:hypothetical protein
VVTAALVLVPQNLRLLGLEIVVLAVHWGGGLYWLAVTALLGIIGAVYAAWVLLIEIVR